MAAESNAHASTGLQAVHDFAVIGAGMVGAAIAYGLQRAGRRVVAIDGADLDYRAAKANFGLVWLQGKGQGKPRYQRLSHRAALLWPQFAQQLEHETGIRLDYDNRGGLHFCLGEEQWRDRTQSMAAWTAQASDLPSCIEMLDRDTLERRFPSMRLGREVSGASYGALDAHVNPLRLLAALQRAFVQRGGVLLGGAPVDRITPPRRMGRVAAVGAGDGHGGHRGSSSGSDSAHCYTLHAGGQDILARRIVIAAGLGSSTLGAMLGLQVPLRPQRGQLLVTERLAPMLPLPASGVRQTGEGTVMIGVTQEEVGYDIHTTTDAAVRMSRRALRIVPQLAAARLVRQWSCLRVMTPDGTPVYAHADEHPSACIALCHSGVTLASYHAGPYAQALADGQPPAELADFHHRRFDVSQTH